MHAGGKCDIVRLPTQALGSGLRCEAGPTRFLAGRVDPECDAFYNPRQCLTRFRLKTFGVLGEVRLEAHPQPQPGADPRGRDAAGSVRRESLGKGDRLNLIASRLIRQGLRVRKPNVLKKARGASPRPKPYGDLG